MFIRMSLSVLALLIAAASQSQPEPALKHPDTTTPGWVDLFHDHLSDGLFPPGVWHEKNGIITPNRDQALWSNKAYDNFILDLEFRNAKGTNSGVFVHASDTGAWVDHSVEIQICDDYFPEWANSPPDWQCAAIFGHQPPSHRTVKPPGQWNHFTISCIGQRIWVVLNGELVNVCDLSRYTSGKKNPDGTEIPSWLDNPLSTLALHGRIGFQGEHAGAPIFFRHIRIRELN
jgi:hypothetical protein